MVRFELQALDADRALLRALAHKLAADGPEAQSIRHLLAEAIGGEPPTPGGVLAALLRSPLVGADLDLPSSGMKVARSTCDALPLDTNIISDVVKPQPSTSLLDLDGGATTTICSSRR